MRAAGRHRRTLVELAGTTLVKLAGRTLVELAGRTLVEFAGRTLVKLAGRTLGMRAGSTLDKLARTLGTLAGTLGTRGMLGGAGWVPSRAASRLLGHRRSSRSRAALAAAARCVRSQSAA
jgi:hypothetical protein